MLALSIRQPFAELILRGIKTVEYRTRPTRIIGERFHIYASLKKLSAPCRNQRSVKTADNIAVPTRKLPEWMLELAEQVGMIDSGALLPTGVIVGSAVIERIEEVVEEVASCELRVASGKTRDRATMYAWHLSDVQRVRKLRKPRGHPQPVWFKPF